MVGNGLKESPIELGLIESAHQEDDRFANALNKAFGACDRGQEVHQPVAWKEFTQAHRVEQPLYQSVSSSQVFAKLYFSLLLAIKICAYLLSIAYGLGTFTYLMTFAYGWLSEIVKLLTMLKLNNGIIKVIQR